MTCPDSFGGEGVIGSSYGSLITLQACVLLSRELNRQLLANFSQDADYVRQHWLWRCDLYQDTICAFERSMASADTRQQAYECCASRCLGSKAWTHLVAMTDDGGFKNPAQFPVTQDQCYVKCFPCSGPVQRNCLHSSSSLRLPTPDEIHREIEMNSRILEVVLGLGHEDLNLSLLPAKHAGEDGRRV